MNDDEQRTGKKKQEEQPNEDTSPSKPDVEYTKGFLGKKLMFQAIIMIGLVGAFMFIGEITADYIIGFEVVWLRVSSVAGLVVCVGLIVSAAFADWMTDRIFLRYMSRKN